MLSIAFGVIALALVANARGPSSYALTGARIFIGNGEVIEEGVLVVDRGLVVSVGTSADIPKDAWVIDARGKSIYPGFIDALGTIGLGEKEEETSSENDGDGEPLARGPEDRPGTRSWKSAADELTLTDDRIESWRDAGFTSSVTVPEEGIFSGQAALINLAGERERDMVVRTPVALRVNLSPPASGRSFPGSLMGVVAYVKQASPTQLTIARAGERTRKPLEANPGPRTIARSLPWRELRRRIGRCSFPPNGSTRSSGRSLSRGKPE